MFSEKVIKRESGILLYGITPPKAKTSEERIQEISQKTIDRVKTLNVDALVVYDLQDESSRNSNERPFPFFPTLEADFFVSQYLNTLSIPKIIYRSVGKCSKEELISKIENTPHPTVFVGAPSALNHTHIKLPEAYNIWKELKCNNLLGGVAIPERHFKQEEHLRILSKMNNGCSFFITQCVYNIELVKNMLSDLYYHCLQNNIQLPTLIFTLTTCGSIKTLRFLDWLGIHVPTWLQNELYHCEDILGKSIDLNLEIAREIISFCASKKIPFGFNIESVSINKAEIEASEILLVKVAEMLKPHRKVRELSFADSTVK